MTSKQKWFIASQGSISSFIAYNGLMSNVDCVQIARSPSSENILKTTAKLTFHPADAEPVILPDAMTLPDLPEKTISRLIVPLKAYDIIPFLKQAKPYLTDNAAIILCHNGLGTIELASDVITNQMDLYFCTTSNGLYKNAKGIFQAGVGDSFWSHVAGNSANKITNKELTSLFNRIEHVDNLQQILWQKLVINCAINPLTAIHNVNNGALAADKYIQSINEIIAETITVAKKVNVTLDFESTRNKVYQVIDNTSANYSSMYQDINANKKTEIDFITGYVVRLAKQFGVATPMSDLLYQQVQTL